MDHGRYIHISIGQGGLGKVHYKWHVLLPSWQAIYNRLPPIPLIRNLRQSSVKLISESDRLAIIEGKLATLKALPEDVKLRASPSQARQELDNGEIIT